jgi:predicted DNA-binding antitoxin AbrB/MazE fold protein
MSQIITVVYENGVLRPLSPLPLEEHQTVQIQVLLEAPENESSQVIQSLVAAGLVTPPACAEDVEPVSEAAWRELTQRLQASSGKPLSEIIIEERGS